MFDSHDKAGFEDYLQQLNDRGSIRDSTFKTYRSWVNRLHREIADNISQGRDFSEAGITRLAGALSSRWNEDHKKDARSILRHYRRYRDLAFVHDEETAITPKKSEQAERQYVLRSIAARRGQASFRRALLKRDGRCIITGTEDETTLEAAHITSHADHGPSDTSNGILLRADVHTLFDLHLISVHPTTLLTFCNKQIRTSSTYGVYHNKPTLLTPSYHGINRNALEEHYKATQP